MGSISPACPNIGQSELQNGLLVAGNVASIWGFLSQCFKTGRESAPQSFQQVSIISTLKPRLKTVHYHFKSVLYINLKTITNNINVNVFTLATVISLNINIGGRCKTSRGRN